jgi:hypothetical protein
VVRKQKPSGIATAGRFVFFRRRQFSVPMPIEKRMGTHAFPHRSKVVVEILLAAANAVLKKV